MADTNPQQCSMASDFKVENSGCAQGSKSANGPFGDSSMQNCYPQQQQQQHQQQHQQGGEGTFNGVQQKYTSPPPYQESYPQNTGHKPIQGPPIHSQDYSQMMHQQQQPMIGYPRNPIYQQNPGINPQFTDLGKPANPMNVPPFDGRLNAHPSVPYVNGPAGLPVSYNNQVTSSVPMPNGPVKGTPGGPYPLIRGPVPQQQQMMGPQQGYRMGFMPPRMVAGQQLPPVSSNGAIGYQPFAHNQQNLLSLPYESGNTASVSPAASEPTSSKSSRNPSPIPNQRYDAMEGQFSSGPSPSASCSNLQTIQPSVTSPPTYSAAALTSQLPVRSVQNVQSGLPPPNNMAHTTMTAHGSSQIPPPRAASSTQGPIFTPPPSVAASHNLLGPSAIPPTSAGPAINTNYPPTLPPAMPTSTSGGFAYPPASQPAVQQQQQLAQHQQQPSGFQAPVSAVGRPVGPRQYPQQSLYNQAPYRTTQESGMMPLQTPGRLQEPQIQQQQHQHQQQQQQQQQQHPAMPGGPEQQRQPAMPPQQQQAMYGGKTSMNPPTGQYPQAGQQQRGYDQMAQRFDNMNIQANDPIDLLQNRNILPPVPLEPVKVTLPQQDYREVNCCAEIFRCTLTKIPESQSLLQKSRLPLGILIHPFKDLTSLPVIQCSTIVRCRSCRTYINPFVHFVEHRRWKCNLCFRINELPEEFLYDPVSKNYGDPSRRPEIRSATIEFIAPSEYMLRPPQPAVYLYVLDVSHAATESGYLRTFCDTLLEELDKLPGDSRTQIGFITFDSSIHFYNLSEGLSQPQMVVVSDIDDIFLPYPDNLLVNLQESKELVQDLLMQLPIKFADNYETDNALGAALQAAFKLVAPTGGRITVVQSSLPNIGPGALKSREDPNLRAAKEVQNLGPANDFYKKLALDCSGQQVAVDLFVVASQYVDIATLSGIFKYSGGCINYYPGFHGLTNPSETERFENDLRRYLTRKVGFESVMRIRCTKGLSIHTFHGNFFVRSTDLLSLPNINPDAGFGMQLSIEENLTESTCACFQAALLYTSSLGERRIRVHTLCLPISNNLFEVLGSADQQAIVGLIVKMAVDRSLMSSLQDAREALINACVDPISVFRSTQTSGFGRLQVPSSLRLLPLYILAIMKHMAFRVGLSTRLDERVFAMNQMKTLPLAQLMLYVYPNLYPVHALDAKTAIYEEDKVIPQPPLLQLSSEKIDSHGVYLLDAGQRMIMFVCRAINDQFCQAVLRASNFNAIDDRMVELPELENPQSEHLRNFVSYLQSERPFHATFHVIREDSKSRNMFLQYLVEDRSESSYSYFEFLQHLKQLLTK